MHHEPIVHDPNVALYELPEWDDKYLLRLFIERRNPSECHCDQNCVFKRLRARLAWLESL